MIEPPPFDAQMRAVFKLFKSLEKERSRWRSADYRVYHALYSAKEQRGTERFIEWILSNPNFTRWMFWYFEREAEAGSRHFSNDLMMQMVRTMIKTGKNLEEE